MQVQQQTDLGDKLRQLPSVATLQRLAATYNTTVLEFFDIPRHKRRLIRPPQRRLLKRESGVEMELLSIGTKMLEFMLFRVPSKAGSDGTYSHVGDEFIFMLKGSLEVWLDEVDGGRGNRVAHRANRHWPTPGVCNR